MRQLHLASYGALADAEADWVFAVDAGALNVVDAVLVEVDASTVRECHRWFGWGMANGSAALAVVAVLRPATLLCGAAAGAVGEHTLLVVDCALSRAAQHRLGAVVDSAPFVNVAISATTARAHLPWLNATAMVVEPVELCPNDLEFAALADGALR